jgi:hypothetical protein
VGIAKAWVDQQKSADNQNAEEPEPAQEKKVQPRKKMLSPVG